jgi:hypothetical protein
LLHSNNDSTEISICLNVWLSTFKVSAPTKLSGSPAEQLKVMTERSYSQVPFTFLKFSDHTFITRFCRTIAAGSEVKSWHSGPCSCSIQTVTATAAAALGVTTELRSSASTTSKVVISIGYSGIEEVTLHAVGVA